MVLKIINWKNRFDIEWRVGHEASFGILVCFMLLLSGTSVSFAQSEKTKQDKTEETTPKLAEQASSAIVIEQDTGKVLFDKNPNEKLPPASMTKIMTMLLIMEQVEKEN